ncbi:endonuclease MutS2 [Paenibacillus marinisediminis]
MDQRTLQRLEYDKVKEKVMNYALSYAGRQHIEQMQPLTQLKSVQHALDETTEATAILKYGASVPIPSLQGIDTILDLLGTGYIFSEQDFSNLYMFLNNCTQLKKYMASKAQLAPVVSSYASSMHELTSLKSEIERCLRNGRVTDAASKELNKVRKKMAIIEDRVKSRIQTLLSKNRSIMQEHLVSLRGDRYVLPIKKEHRKLVNGSVLDESSSGQTVYIEPSEIAQLQHELIALRSDEGREELKILGYLTELAEQSQHELLLNVETVGAYDFLFAKAKYSHAIGGNPVQLNDQGVVNIQGGTHPLLGSRTVPLDFQIGSKYKTLIITGPNTGGKTVALKTVGLLTLMVQSGLLVPLKKESMLSVFTQVYADIGDEQSIEHSLSTFSAHIRNMIDILKMANASTMVLIDEMASGTDPGEGVALSIAMLEELYRKGATVAATTHYNEIKHFASIAPGFENARMEFDADTLKPRYKLRIGEAGHSYAFLIAQSLGISADIIRRSEEIAKSRGGEQGSLDHLVPEVQPYENSKHPIAPKSTNEQGEKAEDEALTEAVKQLEIGDCVYVAYLKRTGIVFELADNRGNVGVMIQKQKYWINQKRLTVYIEKKELYPEDYDFDIIFETKENRKKKKLMQRKHVEGLSIVRQKEDR